MRKFTGKTPDANPAASILCEPAQSKCTWTCHKRHFVQKFTGKMPTLIPQQAFCASLRSRNAHEHVTRGICAENYKENAGRSSRGQHVVRACAVEMHTDMSQEAFCAEIYRKMPDANPAASILCNLRSRNAYGHVTRGILCRNLQGKCRTLIPQQAFCATCAVEMHMDMSQEAFVRKFTRKTPDANPAASMWCEPAQSKCIWTCHKRHLCGNLQGKCQTPGIPPRLNNGP